MPKYIKKHFDNPYLDYSTDAAKNVISNNDDVKHLYRAIKFAEWCVDYTKSHEEYPPDGDILWDILEGPSLRGANLCVVFVAGANLCVVFVAALLSLCTLTNTRSPGL
ncbi:hypothetical protein QE152_g7953 [Popillia japonica]|uniref:Uncharacterized protein n=1 Tax=Popillia japonica TaxID=7064 RepID=A0AAW1MDA6_POPJA